MRSHLLKRAFATEAAKPKAANTFPLQKIASTLFISRVPIVTPELTEFEEKYYKYQDELQRRLMWTFPYFYYFKKLSLAEVSFWKNQKWPVSKQPGVYYPKGEPDIKHMRERLAKQEVIIKEESQDKNKIEEEVEEKAIVPNSRRTKADETNDVKSLERSLDKTLYLIVKKNNQWKFPTFGYGEQIAPLEEYATEQIEKANGKSMNLFTVSNKAIHVLKYNKAGKLIKEGEVENREYFIKGHILAGEFGLGGNAGYEDFAWLRGDELRDYLEKDYYELVEFLLSEY